MREWEVRPLAASPGDSAAVSEAAYVMWLGPGRFVYKAKLAAQKKWALLGWVDGKTSILALDNDDIVLPPNHRFKLRLGESESGERRFYSGDGRLFVNIGAGFTGEAKVIYATDGATWQRVLARDDSIHTKAGLRKLKSARIIGIIDGQPAVDADVQLDRRTDVRGVARFIGSQWRLVLAENDTLPDGNILAYPTVETFRRYGFAKPQLGVIDWGTLQTCGPQVCVEVLSRAPEPGRRGVTWFKRTLLAVDHRDAPRSVLAMREPNPDPTGRVYSAQVQSFDPDIMLVRGPADSAGRVSALLAGTGSAFETLLDEWKSIPGYQVERAYQIADAARVAPGAILLSVLDARLNFNGTFDRAFPDLFLVENGRWVTLPWDSLLNMSRTDVRAQSNQRGGFFPFSLSTLRGYADAIVVSTPFFQETPGATVFPIHLLFDAKARRLFRMPVLKLKGGGTVGLGAVSGWLGDNEVVAVHNGQLVSLKRVEP